MRVGFVLLAVFTMGPGGLLAYAVLWAIMPAPDLGAPVPVGTASANTTLLVGLVLVVVGVAMAFQLRRQPRVAVCIVGDGALMMNLQELQTIVHHQLPIKIIVCVKIGRAHV